MKLKKGVDPRGTRPEITIALLVAEALWARHGKELVVTELFAVDGHSDASAHYDGRAADLRTRYFDKTQVPGVAQELREALGDPNGRLYDVVVESTHIHMEWQPKRRD